jgi:hypothetical protein
MTMYHEGLRLPDWNRRPEYREHLPARDLATPDEA